jgi:hypothetical protein
MQAVSRFPLMTGVALCLTIVSTAQAKVMYVDDDAAGANDGTSWTNAYRCLQDTLAEANDSAKPVEIRVAQGIYWPDLGVNQISGDREATFHLTGGMSLLGGYAGLPGPDPNRRDVRAHETTLSGEIGGGASSHDRRQQLSRPVNSGLRRRRDGGRFYHQRRQCQRFRTV